MPLTALCRQQDPKSGDQTGHKSGGWHQGGQNHWCWRRAMKGLSIVAVGLSIATAAAGDGGKPEAAIGSGSPNLEAARPSPKSKPSSDTVQDRKPANEPPNLTNEPGAESSRLSREDPGKGLTSLPSGAPINSPCRCSTVRSSVRSYGDGCDRIERFLLDAVDVVTDRALMIALRPLERSRSAQSLFRRVFVLTSDIATWMTRTRGPRLPAFAASTAILLWQSRF